MASGASKEHEDMNLPRLTSVLAILGLALAGCGGSSAKTASTTRPSTTAATQTSTAPTTPSTGTTPPSTEISPGVVRASWQGVTATMHASTHHPHVNRPWPVSFVVSMAGKPVKAEVRYQYLFAGQVVGRRSHYRFTGSFHDIFTWPSSAVGYPLTFRAVISSGKLTLSLDYPVQVVR
jgi:hypothetical protein